MQNNRKGFTLVEVTVSIFIFALLSIGVIELVSGILAQSNKQSIVLADVDSARRAAYQFSNELRNAGTANSGAYSIAQADDQIFMFYSNISGSGSLIYSRIRYFISNNSIYKGVLNPIGTTYDPANEVVTPVLGDLANGSSPLFYYYDTNYNATTSNNALTQPVNINRIRFVKINMVITNRGGVSSGTTYTISNGASVRNLKTNLGE